MDPTLETNLLERMGRFTKRPDTPRGDLRRAHEEKEAGRRLANGRKLLGCTLAELHSGPSTRIEEQALVWFLKMHTAVTVVWIAERLNMGHRTHASRTISRFRNDRSAKAEKIKNRCYNDLFSFSHPFSAVYVRHALVSAEAGLSIFFSVDVGPFDLYPLDIHPVREPILSRRCVTPEGTSGVSLSFICRYVRTRMEFSSGVR